MADRLTQLQDCYDQLATQFYASLRYISLHHNASSLDPPIQVPVANAHTNNLNGPSQNDVNDENAISSAAVASNNTNHQSQPSQPSTDPTTQPQLQPPPQTHPQTPLPLSNPSTDPPTQPPHQNRNPNSNPSAPETSLASSLPPTQRPDSPTTFAAAQRELAHDLILKTQQIEHLISVLPGVENSQEEQEKRIGELGDEIGRAVEERRGVEGRRAVVLGEVEGVLGGGGGAVRG